MANRKLTNNFKYFYVNYLPDRLQRKAVRFFYGIKAESEELEYNCALDSTRNILIILPDSLHEIVLLRKYIISVKEHFEDSVIDVVAPYYAKDIIQSNPYIDGGMFFKHDDIQLFSNDFNELRDTIQNREYDTCFLMEKKLDLLKLVLAASSKAALRIGYKSAASYPFLNFSVIHSPSIKYEGSKNESLLRAIGIKIPRGEVKWAISKAFERDVVNILEQGGYSKKKPLVGINYNPCVNGEYINGETLKCLLIDIEKICQQKSVLFFDPDQEEYLRNTIPAEELKKVILFKCESVGLSNAMMKKCDAFITTNNTLYQFAPLLGINTVAIFPKDQIDQWANLKAKKSSVISVPNLSEVDHSEVIRKTHVFTASKEKA